MPSDDGPDRINLEQGILHLKGVPCRVRKLKRTEVALLEDKSAPPTTSAADQRVKVLHSEAKTADFMIDDGVATGVEFLAFELSV